MKLLQILFLVTIFITPFTAASNNYNKTVIPFSGISAVYVGKYGNGSNQHASFFSLNIKPGGVLEEINSAGLIIGKGNRTTNGHTSREVISIFFPLPVFLRLKLHLMKHPKNYPVHGAMAAAKLMAEHGI